LLLRIEEVETFYGRVQALRGVSLEVGEKTIVALLGANGAGKSTVLNTISGLVDPAKGKIEFEGRNIAYTPPEKVVRLGIIQCPEGRRVFPHLTVLENLKMGGYSCRKDQRKLRESFARVMGYFPRLEERKRQRAGTLSGGEQQMLAIARALVADPKLLMIDEASLGLAPIMVTEVFRMVQRINRDGRSILIVEQNAKMALAVAHYAYVLELGEIAVHGLSQDLLRDPRVTQCYLGGA